MSYFSLFCFFPILNIAIQLRSNTSVACPDETVSFTCSAPGANVWTLTPRLGDPVFRNIFSTTAFIGQGFMVPYLGQILPFIVNDNHTDNVSSTFTININNSSLLEGSSIECLGGNREIETLNITIAGELLLICDLADLSLKMTYRQIHPPLLLTQMYLRCEMM